MRWDRSHGWILAAAGALRMLWAIAVPMRPVSDGVAYLTFAQNLAAGGAFGWDPAVPDAFWPPGAPFYYALFFRAFGPGLGPIESRGVGKGSETCLPALACRGFFENPCLLAPDRAAGDEYL